MSRVYPTAFEILRMGYICRYCGAAPGVWCTTPRDKWAGLMHSDRYYQAEPCSWARAGIDFPRDALAEDRLARAIAAARAGDV